FSQKPGDRLLQARTIRQRVEPARAELATKPGQLALCQLAGGMDGTLAEHFRGGGAIQVLPCLAVTHGADRRERERRRMRCQWRERAQAPDLVEEALRQHRVEAACDPLVQD